MISEKKLKEEIKKTRHQERKEMAKRLRMEKKKLTKKEARSREGEDLRMDYQICRKVGFNSAVKEHNQSIDNYLKEKEDL